MKAQHIKGKLLSVVLLISAVSMIAGASLILISPSTPEKNTTSLRIHNVQAGWNPIGISLEDLPMYFQLDVEHTYYGDRFTGYRYYYYRWWRRGIVIPKGEVRYLVLNFSVHISEIDGSPFMLSAPPEAEATIYYYDEVALTGKIKGFGLKAVVNDLPEGCRLSSKYVICDQYGEDCTDDASFVVVVKLDAKDAVESWALPEVKVYINNLFVELELAESPELYWHGPMVEVNVDEMMMNEEDFLDWCEGLHLIL